MRRVSVGKDGSSIWLRWSALSLVVLWTFAAPALSYAQFGSRDRIVEPVQGSRFSTMAGNLHPAARAAVDQGELSPATRLGRVTMFFNRTPEQAADLETLLEQQQDRGSANYHRWLSPEEFADRFGLSQSDVDKIVAWLQSQGLTIEQVSRSRSWVVFSGTAQQVNAALRTDLRRYAVGGETHFMMSREPALPDAFASVVMGFRGLDDFRLKPRVKKSVAPRLTSGISGSHFLTPGDLATIYNLAPLYSAGIDGTGQTVAVMGQTAINLSDVQTFRTLSGLPANIPQVKLIDGSADPGIVADDIDEANLDLDWIGAVAQKATIKYVYADPVNGNGVIDALFFTIDHNLAPVISISYGLCEDTTGNKGFSQSDANVVVAEAQKANSFGITIVAPTGDSGVTDCDSNVPAQQGLSIDLPGATPYVTSVGGTTLSADIANPSGFWSSTPYNPNNSAATSSTATAYIPETSWNDTAVSDSLAAGGGGSSIYFPKPSWQTGTGVPKDGARDVPDISFSASGNHDGYIVCSQDKILTSPNTFEPTCENGFRRVRADPNTNNSFAAFGGTSAGVPIFAGIVALLNQVANTPAGQGNVNPRLYALAASSPSSFHDVTTGDNKVPFKPSTLAECTPVSNVSLGYNAGAGYDLVTGLGSINAQSFVTTWTSVATPAAGPNVTADFQLSLAPAALTVKRGACGTTQLTLTRPNGFAGTPAFTCSAAAPLTAVTCSVSEVPSSGIGVPQIFREFRWWLLVFAVPALTIWLCLALARQSQRVRARAPAFAFVCLVAMLIGCSGGGSGSGSGGPVTPTSTYVFTVDAPASAATGVGTVTITGTIGGVARTAAVTVTVN